MSLRCFIQTQAPIPGTAAAPVRYPVCEWVGDGGLVEHAHPMNRFVCSWLTSDVNTVARCDEVLEAIAHIEAGECAQWFADGDAFCVDFSASGVQFNQSQVGPDDTAHWNQVAGRLAVVDVKAQLGAWRDFLAWFMHRPNPLCA